MQELLHFRFGTHVNLPRFMNAMACVIQCERSMLQASYITSEGLNPINSQPGSSIQQVLSVAESFASPPDY